jgi:hypothetical protein
MFSHKVERNGHAYILDVSFATDAMETLASFEVQFERRPLNKMAAEEMPALKVSALAKIIEHQGVPWLVIEVNDQEVFRETVDQIVGTENVMNKVPAAIYGGGDPFVGCFVRAGISASVEQLLSCWRSPYIEVERLTLMDRIRTLVACARENLPNVAMRAAWRAGFCVAKLGF